MELVLLRILEQDVVKVVVDELSSLDERALAPDRTSELGAVLLPCLARVDRFWRALSPLLPALGDDFGARMRSACATVWARVDREGALARSVRAWWAGVLESSMAAGWSGDAGTVSLVWRASISCGLADAVEQEVAGATLRAVRTRCECGSAHACNHTRHAPPPGRSSRTWRRSALRSRRSIWGACERWWGRVCIRWWRRRATASSDAQSTGP